MAKLAKILRTDIMADMSLPALAQLLQSKGRGKDTILAHITPREAALLKKRGGRGSKNPNTGLLEFEPEVDVPTVDVTPQTETQPTQTTVSPDVSTTPTTTNVTSDVSTTPAATTDVTPSYTPYTEGSGLSIPAAVGTGADAYSEPAFRATPAALSAAAPTPFTDTVSQANQADTTRMITQPDTGTKDTGKILGMSPETLARLGLAGGLGIFGASKARTAGTQAADAQAEQQAIGQPYQLQGQNLVRAAAAGELTPASAQSYQALKAQLAQQTANTGGVGSAQAANQLEAFRQQLLTNQYNYGLQVSSIGDQIALGAIKTGMQLNQQIAQASNSFYTSLAGIAA